ncbi:hypothetical protein [Methanobrevibacter sp.]|uniref:hypothetical protein n=1 Tax=Methanobrevibacter sp. TaxID=66852 RepID=UPI003867426B
MIIQIIQILLINLGINNKTHNQTSLYRVEEPKPFTFTINPLILAAIMIIGMILFTVFIFLFMPGTESGVYYNNQLY